MAVDDKHSSVIGYVHDLVLSFRRNVRRLPPGASEAIATLDAAYRGSRDSVDLGSFMRDAMPPVRHPSGVHILGCAGEVEDQACAARLPDVVRMVTPRRDLAFCFPSFEERCWVRLSGRIETRLVVDELLFAEGFPMYARDLYALDGCRRACTDVVYRVNHIAARRGAAFIEMCGRPPRVKGQKKKGNASDERDDERQFFIRPNLWRVAEPITVDELADVEELAEQRFGKPTAAP